MIGIVGFNDLHLMPFVEKYTNILDDADFTDYEVVFWNRSEVEYQKRFKGRKVAYNKSLNTYLPFHRKIGAFIGYARFLRKTIRERRYDKLIVLTTQTAIPLIDILLGRYKNKFIFDYRDLTKEKKSGIYKLLVLKLFNAASIVMISSLGFLQELGIEQKDNIILAHNTRTVEKKSEASAALNRSVPVRIAFWGMVRQPEFNKAFCDAFGNDERFTLVYHGEGFYKEIEGHCIERGYKNIIFTGRYEYSEIPEFVKNTDILHCVYEYEVDPKMKSALQVKLYDATKYRIPILLSKDSYTAKYVNDSNVAFEIDINEKKHIADLVFSWYCGLNCDRIDAGYEKIEERVYKDDLSFKEHLLFFAEG